MDIVSVATPFELSMAMPMMLVPQMKLILPVGIAGPEIVTVDVQVTL